jgi:hypothetical protein
MLKSLRIVIFHRNGKMLVWNFLKKIYTVPKYQQNRWKNCHDFYHVFFKSKCHKVDERTGKIFSRSVLKIRQILVTYLTEYYLHTKKLKLLFSTLNNFWLRIWNQWSKLSGKNTPYNYLRCWFKNKQVWTSLSEKNQKRSEIFLGLKVAGNYPNNEYVTMCNHSLN